MLWAEVQVVEELAAMAEVLLLPMAVVVAGRQATRIFGVVRQ